jgi:hypothetical protein
MEALLLAILGGSPGGLNLGRFRNAPKLQRHCRGSSKTGISFGKRWRIRRWREQSPKTGGRYSMRR